MTHNPTDDIYRELRDAFHYFNAALFDSALPNCLITMQRSTRSYGFFCGARFRNPLGDRTDEIALNPTYFVSRTETGVLSTLVHEMCHLWQFHFGRTGRSGYHNRQWADRMIAVGLYPSATGQPSGPETGYHMTHYVVERGLFDLRCHELLLGGFRFSWIEDAKFLNGRAPASSPAVHGTDRSNRWKYTCPQCALNAWAKPRASLICATCEALMSRCERK